MLDGGVGNDELHGDFLTDGDVNLNIIGMGEDDMLFMDIMDGGADDDDLWGNFGDDELTGGTGADTFHYEDVFTDGNDTILDFLDGGDADMVNLDDLFDALEASYDAAGYDTDAERMAALIFTDAGGDLVLTIDDSLDGEFADFSITFDGMAGLDVLVKAAIITSE
jgi:Ca2+-binding RTX toxin-like protein